MSIVPKPPAILVAVEQHHFSTLDGLRGIAALVVLTLHVLHPFDLTECLPHAALAVDFFFCLSGFVIAYAYENRLLATMTFTEFATARVIRLYPLILAGTLFGFAVFAAKSLLSREMPFTLNSVTALILEAFLVPLPPMHGQDWPEITPYDPPAWSLFFEFVANFAYAAVVARLSKRTLTFLLLLSGFLVCGQAYVLGGVAGGGKWDELLYGVGRVIFPFFCGVFLFRRWNTFRPNKPSRFAALTPVALLAVLLCPIPQAVNWLYESVAVLLVLPLIINAAATDRAQQRTQSIYLFLGRLSYPLYILHYPFVHIFSHLEQTYSLHGGAFWAVIVAEMVSSIALAFVALKVDEPVRRWLTQKWRSVRSPAIA